MSVNWISDLRAFLGRSTQTKRTRSAHEGIVFNLAHVIGNEKLDDDCKTNCKTCEKIATGLP